MVRVRPLNDREKKHGTLPVISASTSDKTVTVIKGSGSRQVKSSYKFDNVFTSFSTQEDVFEATLQPIIRDVLNGYESTVFAYGQVRILLIWFASSIAFCIEYLFSILHAVDFVTHFLFYVFSIIDQTGTGKTHTMEGDLSNIQEHGVIPRSAAAIFDALKRDPDYVSSTVYCSLLEIYNEELSDLLMDKSTSTSTKRGNPSAKGTGGGTTKLAIMEGENGPFCRGLSESKVTNAGDLLTLMKKAHQQRMTGETDMNKESSRSHCIFTLRVVAKRKLVDGSILEVGGKLHCVDLAGSECAKSCGNAGKQQAARERERMNINRSLLTLGRVVKLLKEKSEKPSSANSVRIPYRDSKLTRILQESLGGRCKTCLIATISPSVTAIEESMSTLNYAQAANGIINKPITTSLMTVGGFDNKSPKGEGASGAGSSIEHWHEMECRLEYMQSQVDEAQQALARKHIQHQEFVERAEKAELAQELAERKFEKATHDISVLESKVEDVSHQLETSEKSLRETKVVLGATQKTENALTEEAMSLIEVLETTITDGDCMHRALVENRKDDVDRKMATKEYQTIQTKLFMDLLNNLQCMGEIQKKHRAELETMNCDHKAMQMELLDRHSAVVEEMKKDCVSDIESLKVSMHDGILPVFRTLTLSSKEKLDSLSLSLEHGEEQLRSQCQSVLDQLKVNSSQITKMELSYNTSSKNVLETLSTHLEATKKHITETVVGITTALQNANEDRQLRNKELRGSIDSFKDQCNGSIKQLVSSSKSHVDSMNQSIQTINDGKENRASILQSITNLDNFAGTKKDDYIQKLEVQLKLLSKQHETLINSNKKQEYMNKALVSNVMSGVQSLIAKEVKLLDEFQSENFRSFIESNEELKSSNMKTTESITETFDYIGKANSQLYRSSRQNFEGQDKLSTTLEAEISSFDANMKSAIVGVRKPIDTFSDECRNALEQFDAKDLDTTESIVDTSKRSVEMATNQLASDVQEGMRKGISDLQALNSEGYKYVREQVLNPVGNEVSNTIQTTQSDVYASTQSELTSLKTEVEEGETNVVEEVNKGLEFASAAQRHLEIGCNEAFTDTINEHMGLIKESTWLENALEAQQKSISNQVAQLSDVVSSSVDCLGGFARDIILVAEETPEVEKRRVPSYSNHLSSTNEPEVLLREAGLCGTEELSAKENNENPPETEGSRKKSSVPPSLSSPLLDRSGSINTDSAIDESPPLKRAADRTKSNLPNGTRNKRYKTRLR